MALVKYNNNSISSVTSAASFPAGAMTLIKTLTASSSSTLSFVDGSSDVVLDNTFIRDGQYPIDMTFLPDTVMEPMRNYVFNLPGYNKDRKGCELGS